VTISLTLSDRLYGEILSHARDSLPREAVGLIGGTPDGVARAVISLSNLASGSLAFLADPYDQFLALRWLRSERLHLLSIYHSHPGGGVEPSPLDIEFAAKWSCAHLVVAVGRGGAPDGTCRAFLAATDGSVRGVPVCIVSDLRAAVQP
jgi:proteasome lid subunit RPN8/RPN11